MTMKTSSSGGRTLLILAAGLLAGALIASLFLLSPPGRSLLAGGGTHADHGDHAEGQLWTCGMHPHVMEEEPGLCPICNMDLVPLRGSGTAEAIARDPEEAHWTCGMHPQVVEDAAGDCPICGMALVPLRESGESAAGGSPSGGGSGGRKILFYRNPMNPTVTSPVPAKDEMGMDYVPVYEEQASQAFSSGTVVRIDPSVQQNMNVVVEPVQRRDLSRTIRTVGYLDYDQQRMVSVTTKYQGYVEQVYANYIGQPVHKGDTLFEIYSPELVQTEEELLSTLDYAQRMAGSSADAAARARDLVDAVRRRLTLWDVSAAQIEELERTRTVFRTLKVIAQADGVVMKRMAGLEGMAIRPGMELMHIADLSSLWLKVEVFENQLSWIDEGRQATISLTYLPGQEFRGRVAFIEPSISPKTRSISLTLEVPNPNGTLRAGMYATVIFEPVVANDAVAVPSLAVIRSGTRNVVVVALGEGRFQPREVELGAEGDGWVQVLDGLAGDEQIVTSSQFLIDSESSLQASFSRMDGE